MIKQLYSEKKYKDVVSMADKYLKLDLLSKNYTHNIRLLRAKSLRYLGCFDEAISELQELSKWDNDNLYSILDLFFIYYHLNRYEEALELLPILYGVEIINNHTLLIMELVMKTQLGIPVTYRKGTRSDYIKEQIVNYDSEKALEHISLHKYANYSKDVHSRFNDNVDI